MKRFFLSSFVFVLCGLIFAPEGLAGDVQAGDADYQLAGLGVLPLGAPFTFGGIVNIDPQTGVGIPTGTSYRFEFDGVGENLSSDSQGRLYNIGTVIGSEGDLLNQFDAASGKIVASEELSGRPEGYLRPSAVAFSSDDTLYAVLHAALGYRQLLTKIDTAGGAYEIVTTLDDSVPVILDVAFDSSDALYALGRDVGLLKIDVLTGETLIVGGNLDDLWAVTLEFTPEDKLFATGGGHLLSVDPSTGLAEDIGPISSPYAFVGLAAIPEPSGILLVLWLFPSAILTRTRRRT